MPKKRKTRQQKIILQLKRELARQKRPEAVLDTKSKPSQEAIFVRSEVKPKKKVKIKKADFKAFLPDSKLIRHDLARTLLLTLGILSLEVVLYLKLR